MPIIAFDPEAGTTTTDFYEAMGVPAISTTAVPGGDGHNRVTLFVCQAGGTCQPRDNKGCSETIIVQSGTIVVRDVQANTKTTYGPGAVCSIPPHTTFTLEVLETAEMVCVFSPAEASPES